MMAAPLLKLKNFKSKMLYAAFFDARAEHCGRVAGGNARWLEDTRARRARVGACPCDAPQGRGGVAPQTARSAALRGIAWRAPCGGRKFIPEVQSTCGKGGAVAGQGPKGGADMAEKQDQQTVYKLLSADMRQGLKNIYQQISTASGEQTVPAPETDALFHEASDQLGEVLKTTETATMNIMEIVEKHLELQAESAKLLAAVRENTATPDQTARLVEINRQLGDDLTSLLTALSFQDITGQRIKRVVTALNKIEDSVVELYVSSGLIMDGAEKHPDKDAQALQSEAQKAVQDFRQNRKVTSTLKGPDKNGVSQSAIDDMLAQLGM